MMRLPCSRPVNAMLAQSVYPTPHYACAITRPLMQSHMRAAMLLNCF